MAYIDFLVSMKKEDPFNMAQAVGTKNKVIKDENKMPKARETAIGIIFSASELCALISGINPINVVAVVRNIARKRALPANITALKIDVFCCEISLIFATNIRLSLITIPATANNATYDSNDSGISISK